MSKKDFNFYQAIDDFNALYKLEKNTTPTLLPASRVKNFHDIVGEEVSEGLDLAKKYEEAQRTAAAAKRDLSEEEQLNLLTEMADWLGDLTVYIASESLRWGLPLPEILQIIMESNASKLGADGRPLYDERGKVMKGPGYWKPEPRIKALLAARLAKKSEE